MSLGVLLEAFTDVNGDGRQALSRFGQCWSYLLIVVDGRNQVAVKVIRFHTSEEDPRVSIYITLIFTLFYVDLLGISTRGLNLGTSRPRKYCFSFWNNGGVWAVHIPCVSVVPARHVVPTNCATRY
jgi:hypothetical protein